MLRNYEVAEHKCLEIQSDWRNSWTAILGLRLATHDGDHKGWSFSIELFTVWYFGITYYDTRHEEHYNNEDFIE